jgi:hypothetical protein
VQQRQLICPPPRDPPVAEERRPVELVPARYGEVHLQGQERYALVLPGLWYPRSSFPDLEHLSHPNHEPGGLLPSLHGSLWYLAQALPCSLRGMYYSLHFRFNS